MKLREAINKKCINCVFDPLEPGTWRYQVYQCTATDCPLFEVRPKPIAKKAKISDKQLEVCVDTKNLIYSENSPNLVEKNSLDAIVKAN